MEGIFLSGFLVRVVSEISEICLGAYHAFADIFLIYEIVTIIHTVGLMTRDLFDNLPRDTSSIHMACCGTAVVVHEFARQSGFHPCSMPRTVVVFAPVSIPMKDIRA